VHAALVAFAVLRFGLRLELGPEFDSNVDRVDVGPQLSTAAADQPAVPSPPPVSSFLVRATARGTLSLASGKNSLRLALDTGGKWFFASDAHPQDQMVVRATVDGRHRVSDRFAVAIGGEYWDSFQWIDCLPLDKNDPTGAPETWCHRDFRQAGLRLLGQLADEVPGLTVEAGVRNYQWKPDDDLSFLGVGGALTPSARWRGRPLDADGAAPEWTLSTTGRIEWRLYHGPALRFADDLGDARLPGRRDLVASWSASLSYLGPLLASAGYLVEADRSNSAGASFLYQALTLQLAFSLGAGITAAARAQLLFFSTGAAQALYGDDENRNMILFDLSREMGAGFTLAARYSVFRNAAGASREYLRQLVSLGVTWAR
jgi:hypothetical protein